MALEMICTKCSKPITLKPENLGELIECTNGCGKVSYVPYPPRLRSYKDSLEISKVYWEKWKHENTVINQRMRWIIFIQSVLIGSISYLVSLDYLEYSNGMDANDLIWLMMISLFGQFFAGHVSLSISAAVKASEILNHICLWETAERFQLRIDSLTNRMGFGAANILPAAFSVLWFLAVIAISGLVILDHTPWGESFLNNTSSLRIFGDAPKRISIYHGGFFAISSVLIGGYHISQNKKKSAFIDEKKEYIKLKRKSLHTIGQEISYRSLDKEYTKYRENPDKFKDALDRIAPDDPFID